MENLLNSLFTFINAQRVCNARRKNRNTRLLSLSRRWGRFWGVKQRQASGDCVLTRRAGSQCVGSSLVTGSWPLHDTAAMPNCLYRELHAVYVGLDAGSGINRHSMRFLSALLTNHWISLNQDSPNYGPRAASDPPYAFIRPANEIVNVVDVLGFGTVWIINVQKNKLRNVTFHSV
jgi:hypothetical protein